MNPYPEHKIFCCELLYYLLGCSVSSPYISSCKFFDCLMGESNVIYNVSFYFFLHRYLLLYGFIQNIQSVSVYINTLPYVLVKGFGSGSAFIRIYLNCWILIWIQVYELYLNFEVFYIRKNVLFDTFSHE